MLKNLIKKINYPKNIIVKMKKHQNCTILFFLSALGLKTLKISNNYNIHINQNLRLLTIVAKSNLFLKKKKILKSQLGLYSILIKNSLNDLTTLSNKCFILNGIGFKGHVIFTEKQQVLKLSLGYSHEITIPIPNYFILKTSPNKFKKTHTFILLSSDRQKLNEFIKYIISFKKFDSYKGKGILIDGEKAVKLKETKK